MKNMIKVLAIISAVMLMMSGCADNSTAVNADNMNNTTVISGTTAVIDSSDMFTERDLKTDYDESKSVKITLSGSSASCSSSAVEIKNGTVTVKDEGTYILSGSLTDGMIIVDADESDKPQLVLDGVNIVSKTSAPIYVKNANKVFITLAKNSENTLSNGGSFTAIDDNNIDSVIFSKQDLTLNGEGKLTVTSPAGHGIVSKDDLVLTSGEYTVTSASHGIDANNSVRVINATLTVDAGKDGIHTENTDDATLGFLYIASGSLIIDAEGDGMSAGAYMQIQNGSIYITSGGGSKNSAKQTSDSWGGFMGARPGESASSSTDDSSTSIKGLKATGELTINGGSFKIDSADDSIHSNSTVIINGGNFDITSGDDGVHADETLKITDCTMKINESYEGLEALNIEISGGKIVLSASDDGLNAAGGTDSSGYGGNRPNEGFGGGGSSSNGSITVSGGYIYADADGDGLDSNGTIAVTGGVTLVSGPTNDGNAAFDYDGSASVSGGVLIALGTTGMAQNFTSADNQSAALISFSSQSANRSFAICGSDGKVIASMTPSKAYTCAVITSPDIQSGNSYSVVTGATVSGADEYGYANNASKSGGTTVTEFTVSSSIYGGNGSMGGGMAGGGVGGAGGGAGGANGGGKMGVMGR